MYKHAQTHTNKTKTMKSSNTLATTSMLNCSIHVRCLNKSCSTCCYGIQYSASTKLSTVQVYYNLYLSASQNGIYKCALSMSVTTEHTALKIKADND